MLEIPFWKRIVITGACVLGLILALPNFFYQRVETHNDAVKTLETTNQTPQLLQDKALWPDWLPSGLVNLGLDLRGGAHLLAEVQLDGAYKKRLDAFWPDVLAALREKRDVIGTIRRQKTDLSELHILVSNPENMSQAIAIVQDLTRPVASLDPRATQDFQITQDGDMLVIALSDAEKRATDTRIMAQTLEIIRRRVDEVGTREPNIQQQGNNRVLIQVPGLGSAKELEALIGTTAQLTFHPVVRAGTDPKARVSAGNLLLPSIDEPGVYYTLERAPVVTGEELVDAQPSFDQNGTPSVSFRFNPSGARKFGRYTANNVGLPFAIVLDNEVVSAPRINEAIPTGSGIITGNFSVEEANHLAILLRAGALPAQLEFLQKRTIGPDLGQDSIDAGRIACIIAFAVVLIFMVASYGWFGMIANIALLTNIVLLFALLSVVGATLTLPGIAGIVLTVGMAVDANVLVFERIREEIAQGKGPANAIHLGYEKALSAIFDANITTLITALILFMMGSGPVRGFAITLGFGIVTSVFTAVFVTRLLIVAWMEYRRPKTLVI